MLSVEESVFVRTTWRERQSVAQRLLAAARHLGLDVRVVQRRGGGYLVPAEVALALSAPAPTETPTPDLEPSAEPADEPATPGEQAAQDKPAPSSGADEQQEAPRKSDAARELLAAEPDLSNAEIARRAGVSATTVGKLRKAQEGDES